MSAHLRLILLPLLLLLAPAAAAGQTPGSTADQIEALARAAAAAPDDPSAHARLSQVLAAANRPADALRAIERALALEPRNPDHVRAFAVLATWVGDYAAAAEKYRLLRTLRPDDTTVWLDLARVSAWSGEIGAAVDAYRLYLREHPDAADVWLELATTESWRGNYAAALDALDVYRSRFGASSTAYAVTLARVYAAAGRPSQAMALLEPLHRQDPSNYDVNLARTIALTMKREVGEARESLAVVRRLDPANAQTRNAERLLRAMLGSSIQPQVTFYADSDDLRTFGFTPAGSLMLSSGTRLSAGWSRHVLDGTAASGLGRLDGQQARHDEVWAEIAQGLGPLTLSGRVGSARTGALDRTPYVVSARLRTDVFSLGASRREGFVLISPKTLELGLTERRHQVDVSWSPTLRFSMAADAAHQQLSDGNTRWEVRLAPQWSVLRSSALNLDVGAAAYRLSAERDLSNGYYDPASYESYLMTVFPYMKISENVGASLSLGIGAQRERGLAFRLGGSGSAELTFGIYRAWLLRAGGSLTHNMRHESGAFRGYSASLSLARRF